MVIFYLACGGIGLAAGAGLGIAAAGVWSIGAALVGMPPTDLAQTVGMFASATGALGWLAGVAWAVLWLIADERRY